jgi:diguanylate cyclase (GGDEF)-like protein/PAS domain S-box-containing protein
MGVDGATPLTWVERARRVRAGEPDLATATVAMPYDAYRDLFDTILSQSFDSVVLCARLSGEYYAVSDSFCRLTGYTPAELLGRTSVELGMVDTDGTRRYAETDTAERRPGIYENTLTRKDGEQRVVEFSHQFVGDEYTIVIIRDITERRAQEFVLLRQATADPLTGLLNRRGFTSQAEQLLRDATARARPVHLVMADLDGLKQVNDEGGHAAGDEAIRQAAAALRTHVLAGALVGRLGGDEFVFVVDGGSLVAVEQMCAAVADSAPLTFGIASTTDGHTRLTELLGAADAAMYDAKRRRRRPA